jgi:predicted  nucleic acid-binding Zn-ribbon protein
MSTDLRGFRYTLEPLLRRQRWELEALQARIAQVNRDIGDGVRALESVQARLAAHSQQMTPATSKHLDPLLQQCNLHWLTRLRDEIARSQRALETLRGRRDSLMADHLRLQGKLGVLERHREQRLAEYSQECQSRTAAAADREWLARRQMVAQRSLIVAKEAP